MSNMYRMVRRSKSSFWLKLSFDSGAGSTGQGRATFKFHRKMPDNEQT